MDGEDFAWLWDVDLDELAPQVVSLVTAGTKAEELALRYKYAGVSEERMHAIRDLPAALDAALGNVETRGLLYILPGPRHLGLRA